MFRGFRRRFFPNPLDRMLKKLAGRKGKKILFVWNRGLGDIALGLYAMIQRVYDFIPDAEITFLTRKNLEEGFLLLDQISVLIDPFMERGVDVDVEKSLANFGKKTTDFDLVIEKPSPSDWVVWQRGKIVPKLSFKSEFLDLWKKFELPDGFTYIALQPVIETKYGLWRNWPLEKWNDLLDRLEKFPFVKVVLLGSDDRTEFLQKNIIDLRGKTTLFEMLSIISQKISKMVLQDSGILSMTFYLNSSFPIDVISLWADPNHGILKQNVNSPNLQLNHIPLIAEGKDLNALEVSQVMDVLFPIKPVTSCVHLRSLAEPHVDKKIGCVILAGGQGSRMGLQGPKGLFTLYEKSLFEWICLKCPSENFPIAVMTSQANHNETVDYFLKNHCFGRQVYFFQQESLPFLSAKKEPLVKHPAPSGNGSFYESFVRSKLFDLFSKKGVEALLVIPVDNPMATPLDLKMIDFLFQTKSDVIVKCIARDSQENMGAIVQREGGFVEVLEYLHLDPSVSYDFSNTGILAMTMSYIEAMSHKNLPIHLVEKKIPGLNILGWKPEKFIFDAFVYGKVFAIADDRASCYNSIKNLQSPFPSRDALISSLHKSEE